MVAVGAVDALPAPTAVVLERSKELLWMLLLLLETGGGGGGGVLSTTSGGRPLPFEDESKPFCEVLRLAALLLLAIAVGLWARNFPSECDVRGGLTLCCGRKYTHKILA